jgi:hypothetical protein
MWKPFLNVGNTQVVFLTGLWIELWKTKPHGGKLLLQRIFHKIHSPDLGASCGNVEIAFQVVVNTNLK